MAERVEFGHRYYGAFKTGKYFQEYDGVCQASSVAVAAIQIGFNPTAIAGSVGVFAGGRTYDHVVQEDGAAKYSVPSSWPVEVEPALSQCDRVMLTGINFDLHDQDTAAGAGLAYLGIWIAPTHIIDARGRVGIATVEEAKVALRLGHNVGMILKHDDFDECRRFLEGKTATYPTQLSAYWATLEIEADDLICDLQGIGDWVKAQSVSSRSLRGRPLDAPAVQTMLHYAFNYSAERESDLVNIKRVIDSLR